MRRERTHCTVLELRKNAREIQPHSELPEDALGDLSGFNYAIPVYARHLSGIGDRVAARGFELAYVEGLWT